MSERKIKEAKVKIGSSDIARLVLMVFSIVFFWLSAYLMETVMTLVGILMLACALLVFTYVKEAKGKVVARLGGFKKAIITWEGYRLDKEWNVIKNGILSRLHFGGLHFVGFWPFDRILKYRKRYQTLHIVQGKDESQVVFREEEFEDIPLQPTTYVTIERDVETKPPERLRVSVTFLFTYEITNFYKALFRASISFHEKAKEHLDTVLVSWITKQDVDGLLTAQRDPEKLWSEIQKDPVIGMLRDDWGIHILEKNGIRVQDIQFPKEYQDALALKKKTALEAEAAKKKMEIEAKARASETMGTVIEMLHQESGLSKKAIKQQIKDDPEAFVKKYKPILEKNWDLLNRKIAIEGKSFMDIRVEGAEGIERALLNIITAWQRIPQGKGGEKKEEKPKEEKEPKKKKPDFEETEKEFSKEFPE